MKKIVSFFVAFVLVVCAVCGDFSSMTVKAATSGVTGDCTWTLDGTVLTISGEGEMADYSYGSSPWGTEITEVNIENGVTSIGDTAFYGCSALTSITIPGSVTSIGDRTFLGCTALKKVYIANLAKWCQIDFETSSSQPMFYGSELFLNEELLTDVIIPEGVTSISSYAFYRCSGLTSVTIPEGVTSIGFCAFFNCSSLTSITIPEGVTSIKNSAFSACSSLTSITIPEGVTSIGDSAFSGCSGLTSVTIPGSVTSIGIGAFSGCSGLTSVTIPGSVTSIRSYAFNGCGSLTSITLPGSVTSIRSYAFNGCGSLTSVWFTGSQVDRDEMTVESGNDKLLYDATWHYNTCADNAHIYISNCDVSCQNCDWIREVDNAHVYLADCDVSCQNCDWIREVDNEHIFAMNAGYTCEGCGYSKKPVAPEIESKTNSSVTLVHISGCEYSKDGENWQDSNIFTGLSLPSGSSTYTFYQRIKATEQVQVSEKSEGLVVTFAAGGVTGECRWTLDGTVLTISGKGRMADYYNDPSPWGTEITKVIIKNDVWSIGSSAFKGCSSLTSITIPKDVSSIGSSAFKGCSSLTNITIQKGQDTYMSIKDSAFEGCSSLTSITIPEGVYSIGSSAFKGCSSLTSITIPEDVWEIGSSVFEGCSSLTSITIPEGVGEIGSSAFKDCSSLTSITIPEDVYSIGSSAFEGCSSLTSITIPEDVWEIGSSAFEGCSSLTSITIPEGVGEIGPSAFKGCSSLTNITIQIGHDAYMSIKDSAFEGCSLLTSVWFIGSQVDRDDMTIDGDNEELLKATWHYNTCADNAHIYLSNCDVSCQNCDWTREVDNDHIFALNTGYTCQGCGYSKQPVAPQIESKTNSSVTLVHIPGCEYSKDGENWQDSNVFTDLSLLSGSSTYTFYQRIKATEQVQVSEKSEGLVVTFKTAQSRPSAPMVSSCTDTSVTLVEITNGEYSIDGVNWQSSNVFDNLSPNTEYIFYQRYAENDSYEVSNVSVGLTVTTDLPYILGDVNGDEYVTTDDAIQLLYHIMFGDSYLISQPCDFDGNGLLTSDDAIYLQYHINFPDRYPLK